MVKQINGDLQVPGFDAKVKASVEDPAYLVEVLDKVKHRYVHSGINVALKESDFKTEEINVTEERASQAPDLLVKLKNAKAEESENEDGEKVGIIEGDANVKGIYDLGGDLVTESAFTQTVKHKNGKVVLLSDHFYTMADVAGVAYLEDTDKSLRMKAEINLDTQKNRELYSNIKFLLKRGVPPGLSIGYDPIKFEPNDKGGYDLHEVSVHEVSVTPFPMNQESFVDFAKSRKEYRKRRQALLQKVNRNAPKAVA